MAEFDFHEIKNKEFHVKRKPFLILRDNQNYYGEVIGESGKIVHKALVTTGHLIEFGWVNER